jgi:molybdopterin-containing oxidoreductase family iron-sulfur binding subunit
MSPAGLPDDRQAADSRLNLPLVDSAAAGVPPEGVVSRRTFLKLAGFSFGSLALSGCQREPVQKAVPYLTPVEGIVPGRTYQYAAFCGACSAGCGLLTQNRDGRPIKLEGNPDDAFSRGGLCATGQASILGLYDRLRLQQPLKQGQPSSWDEIDAQVRGELDKIRKQGGAVRLLSCTLSGPTSRALLQQFLGSFRDARHVVHDTPSYSAILDAHQRTHGVRVLPHYRFEPAEVIVSIDADFLGTWIAPVEFSSAYQANRRLEGPAPHLSQHIQFESRLSLTGSKADQRFTIAPGQIGLLLSHLAARLSDKAAVPWTVQDLEQPPVPAEILDQLAQSLWQSRGRSLVLCGSQDIDEQLVCNLLNHALGNYGTTLNLERPSYQYAGSDRDVKTLVDELHDGRVAALFVVETNLLHDLPESEQLVEALKHVPLLVTFTERMDETAALVADKSSGHARYVCPVPHYLETWTDAELFDGTVNLSQPAIQPLGNTRSLIENLAAWSANPKPAYDLVRETWEKQVYSRRLLSESSFQRFWDSTVQAGYARVKPRAAQAKWNSPKVAAIRRARHPSVGAHDVVLYHKVGLPSAAHAYNPWLQELPDPITKVTWDNYACLSPAAAARLSVSDGDVIRLEASGLTKTPIELPVLVQRGQHDQVVAVALGYGCQLSARFAAIGPRWIQAGPTVGADGLVGTNAAPLLSWDGETLHYNRSSVRLTKTDRHHPLAVAQTYPSLDPPPQLAPPTKDRQPVVQEMTLAALLDNSEKPAPTRKEDDNFWPADHPETGHRWGMAIDLNACTGCSACVVACQVENNIPVVGKDEVLRHREMHWLRIDRYYSNLPEQVQVAHQPMLCQHCGNAPCEVVCPVLATVHSAEGLNQQIYNRCVGTRYCANNCPYKVRRFNWFDYAHDDPLYNLLLNPAVTVRTRGVMEKCTFCVQRIEQARVLARQAGRPLADGDIQTACQQSCPTQAIVFGDLNDPESRVAKLRSSRRAYRALEELNVRPAVSYLALVRQPEPRRDEHG